MEQRTERDALGRRKPRRQAQFARQVAVKLEADALARVEGLADGYGLSVSEVLRRCVATGLPRVKDALRKAKDGVL